MDNKVDICGKCISVPEFSHEIGNNKFYKFDVEVVRTSGNKDRILCFIKENTVVELGKFYCISGMFRSIQREHLLNYVYVTDIQESDAYYSNSCEIEGYVVSKPVFSDRIKNGKKICKFVIANNQGKRSSYVPVVIWGIYAEITKNCEIGDQIKAKGRIESRKIDKKEDNRTVIELSVGKLEVIEK